MMVLLFFGFFGGGGAWAGTQAEALTLTAQAASSDVVFTGEVASVRYAQMPDDGFPVTYYELSVSAQLLGSITSGAIELVLPGGPLGDVWVNGGAPKLHVGEQILLLAVSIDDGLVRLRQLDRSLFKLAVATTGDPFFADAWNRVVTSLSCTDEPVLVRPLDEEPAAGGDDAWTVYAADPSALAMSWSDAVAELTTCVVDSGAVGLGLTGISEAP